jgi:hypothetical protein
MAGGGGKRGRPAHVPPLKRICVHLTDEQMRLLRMWGRGDLAAGLRWLIDVAAPHVRKRATPDRE